MFRYYLNWLLNLTILRYLNDSSCVIILSGQNTSDIGLSGEIPSTQLNLESEAFDENLMLSLHFGCQIFVIISETPTEAIDVLEKAIKRTDQRFNRRKLIITPTQFDVPNRKELLEILKSPVFEFVPDLVLVLPLKQLAEVSSSGLLEVNNSFHNFVLKFIHPKFNSSY